MKIASFCFLFLVILALGDLPAQLPLQRPDAPPSARLRFYARITTYPGISFPTSLAVGDFNNDGIPDLTTVAPTNGIVALALGKGNGRFGTWHGFQAASVPGWVTNGDLNGDGNLDAVVNDGAPTL